MVKVDVGSMSSQSSSVSSIVNARVTGLNSAVTALNALLNEDSLQGTAYTSAKGYASNVLIPLIQAMILYSESVSENTAQLNHQYASIVGEESLDSEILEQQIQSLENSYLSARYSHELLLQNMSPSATNFVALMDSIQGKLATQREKLRKLNHFNSVSAHTFSDIGSLEVALMSGLNQVSANFSGFSASQGFPSYNKSNLSWAKAVSSQWEEREENGAKAVYQDVMQRIENGEEVTAEAVTAALSALHSLGISEVPETLLNKAKEFYNSDAGGYAISGGSTAVEEWLNTFLSGLDDSIPDSSDYWTVYSTGNGYWKNFHASFNSAGYSSALSQSTQNGVLKSLTSSLDIPFSNTGLTAVNLSPVSSAFMGLDFAMNLQNENVGRAFLHTAVTTVATTIGVEVVTTGLVAASVGTGFASTVATGLLAMNPVGLAVVTTIGVGLAVNFAYNSNFLGVKDIVNDMGDRMTENLEDIGQALSSGWDSLTGAFGW